MRNVSKREIEDEATGRASDCGDAIQLELGLTDTQRQKIERVVKHELISAMREIQEREAPL